MSAPRRWARYLARGTALLLGLLLPLLVVEIGYRLTRKPPRQPPTAVFCGDCPYLFHPNPARPDISSQHLRDREFTWAAPEGTFRILVLGDSLPYGLHVAPQHTFPKILEARLGERSVPVEVINGGVVAYSPYNERMYYAHHLREFHAKLVVISFCMNDVVDPVLHWARLVSGPFQPERVPPDAIPNPAYHAEHALPLYRKWVRDESGRAQRILGRSELYKRAVAPLLAPRVPDTAVSAGGKTYPAYLSGEDTLGMGVLMDYESVEWQWLRRQYDELIADIRADGADVVILVNPLRYQLMAGFPLDPARLFERYCREQRVRCFDVLPVLAQYGGEKLFLGELAHAVDIWHYNPKGHQVVGSALAAFLVSEGMIPGEPRAPSP